MKLKREISFNPQPGRMRVCFRVRGKNGVVQFVWLVRTKGDPHERHELWEVAQVPEGRGLDFHSKKPRPGMGANDKYKCDVLKQGYCYCDGSGLQAEEVGERFIVEGEDAVWSELELRYRDWLESEEAPPQ